MMRRFMILALAVLAGPAAAQESAKLPIGAVVCRTVELAAEHTRIAGGPAHDAIDPFIEAQIRAGTCRVILAEVGVTVVAVDPRPPRGFARVTQPGQPEGWIDSASIWGYFDAPARVKAWPGR
jgi:SH3-like domain-containing protein